MNEKKFFLSVEMNQVFWCKIIGFLGLNFSSLKRNTMTFDDFFQPFALVMKFEALSLNSQRLTNMLKQKRLNSAAKFVEKAEYLNFHTKYFSFIDISCKTYGKNLHDDETQILSKLYRN